MVKGKMVKPCAKVARLGIARKLKIDEWIQALNTSGVG